MFKPFLYFLTDKDGNSYRVNRGAVDKTATPTPLINTPDGWQEKSIKYGRSNKYFALFRTFTTPLKFVADAAKIVRDQFYKLGSEAEMFLIITRLNNEWIHRQFYKGELDFTQCEDSEFQVTANVMEGELSKLFKAGEDTVYELPLADGRQVKVDGLVLKQSAKYYVSNGALLNTNGNHVIDLMLLGQEGPDLNILSVPRTNLGASGQNQFILNNNLHFHNPSTKNPMTVSWDFKVTTSLADGISPNPAVRLILSIRIIDKRNGNALGRTLQEFVGPTNTYRKNHFVGSSTVTEFSQMDDPSNYVTALVLGINLVGASADQAVFHVYDSEGFFNIDSIDFRHPATTIRALDPITVGQMLVDKMTGGGYEFRSNHLAAEWGSLLITSGDGVRGLEGAVLKTSFTAFFNSYNVVSPLAMGIDGKTIWIEDRSQAWPSTAQPLDLGAVSDLKAKPANDHLFNTIKIGYPDSKLDDVNGRNEFNTTHIYSAPVSRSVRELNLVSTYKAGMYDIEFTRINLEGKKTTNSSTDNDVFFLHTEKYPQADGVYKLLRLNYSPVSGLLDAASAFNIELSPKRCLQRHGAYLRGAFYYQPMGVLKFESGDRNVDMITGTVSERADFPINAMGDPLFVPLEFTFECPVPEDMIEQLETMPQRPVLFSWNGTVFVAYPTDIAIQPATNATQSVSALCAVGNDLTKLIV
jgi:hypothetical protein